MRHDYLKVGQECPNSGRPFDGYSWTVATPFDTCRACGCRQDPRFGGVGETLARLERDRAGLAETTFRRHNGPAAHPRGFRPIGGGR